MSHLQSFAKVLPVLLVIGLGAVLRRLKVLGPGTAQELKKLVVTCGSSCGDSPAPH